jgi:hypothetical protein
MASKLREVERQLNVSNLVGSLLGGGENGVQGKEVEKGASADAE